AARGIFAWSGNFYALPLSEALGLEPDGALRVGLLHYNTSGEVDRLVAALEELLGG
ncbi:MAG: cysteine desulfurase-like protein, partial [Planctomycetes bacterium]|nr:cysteine desulfurase-like protein [Planctomycetota bacterium]